MYCFFIRTTVQLNKSKLSSSLYNTVIYMVVPLILSELILNTYKTLFELRCQNIELHQCTLTVIDFKLSMLKCLFKNRPSHYKSVHYYVQKRSLGG